ncbi:hypothetical protein B0H63DRAFT_47215 [Podospora didyma]|uniref:Uncharacterized protein n=1 Tax=Podospora didyma TaxID=330526 RepID=A0AAE0U897_9PEZI|nr:hypothetical protein B0H63DRAFT_47215 [Podospora didyma]
MQLQSPVIAISLVGGACVAADQKRIVGASSSSPQTIRQFESCAQTYGQGWVQCGDEESGFCYNPGRGQSCCGADSGFCNDGAYCAPAARYCCVGDEDLVPCAANAGFKLPMYARLADPVAPPHELSSPIKTQRRETDEEYVDTGPSINEDPSSPHIQMSVARKETLAWMWFGIGAVGLFMFSC